MNFFEKFIGLRTKHCFSFNGTLFFVVKPNFVAKAIGENGINIRKLALKLRRRIRIIAAPSSIADAEKFVASLVYPVQFKKFSIQGGEACITASQQSRAMIIGRNKTRLAELEKILDEYFNIKKLKLI
jgi:transcription antitermination factor NusA-like protein